MPNVVCPHCAAPTVLPDPWPHPGFTCPRCRATVAFALPPAPPAPVEPPPDPLDFADDEPARPRRYRARGDSPVATGFELGFGQELGRQFAHFIVGCGTFLLIGGVIAFCLAMWLSGR